MNPTFMVSPVCPSPQPSPRCRGQGEELFTMHRGEIEKKCSLSRLWGHGYGEGIFQRSQQLALLLAPRLDVLLFLDDRRVLTHGVGDRRPARVMADLDDHFHDLLVRDAD